MLGAGPTAASDIAQNGESSGQRKEFEYHLTLDMKEIIQELGVEAAKLVDTPMSMSQWSRGTVTQSAGCHTVPEARSQVENYLAMDRPDILYAASII